MGRTKTLNRKYKVNRRGQTMKRRGVRKPTRQSRYGKQSTARSQSRVKSQSTTRRQSRTNRARSQSTARRQSRTRRARRQGRYSRKTVVRRRTNTRRTKKMIGGGGGNKVRPVSFVIRYEGKPDGKFEFKKLYASWESGGGIVKMGKKEIKYFTIEQVNVMDGKLEFLRSPVCKQSFKYLELKNNEVLYTINPKGDGDATYTITDFNNKSSDPLTFDGKDATYSQLLESNPFLPQEQELVMFYRTYEKETGKHSYIITGTYMDLNLNDLAKSFNNMANKNKPDGSTCSAVDVDEAAAFFAQAAEDGAQTVGPTHESIRRISAPLNDYHANIEAVRKAKAGLNDIPVDLTSFEQLLTELKKDTLTDFSALSSSLNPAVESKNGYEMRYKNILPSVNSGVRKSKSLIEYQQSLVKDGLIPFDYFNADMIKFHFNKDTETVPDFIAVSCPKIEDDLEERDPKKFQDQIWDKLITNFRIGTIVRLTNDREGGRSKCYAYQENIGTADGVPEPKEYGNIKTRKLADKSKVKIHHYKNWPDHGVPNSDDMKSLVSLAEEIKNKVFPPPGGKKKKEIVIVHCSAGVGRTGTFILMVYILRILELMENNKIKLFNREFDVTQYAYLTDQLIQLLRIFRKTAVQGNEQADLIKDFLEEKEKSMSASTTGASTITPIATMDPIYGNPKSNRDDELLNVILERSGIPPSEVEDFKIKSGLTSQYDILDTLSFRQIRALAADDVIQGMFDSTENYHIFYNLPFRIIEEYTQPDNTTQHNLKFIYTMDNPDPSVSGKIISPKSILVNAENYGEILEIIRTNSSQLKKSNDLIVY